MEDGSDEYTEEEEEIVCDISANENSINAVYSACENFYDYA